MNILHDITIAAPESLLLAMGLLGVLGMLRLLRLLGMLGLLGMP